MTALPRLSPGDAAPTLALPDQDGTAYDLAEHRGSHVVVYFYPAAMTPGCTAQACDFRDSLASLASAGYEVVGVSHDEPGALREFRERDGLDFPLLSDPGLTAHRAWGAWGEKSTYGRTSEGVLRSTFVVDPEGRLELALYNVKAAGHVAMLKRRLGLAA